MGPVQYFRLQWTASMGDLQGRAFVSHIALPFLVICASDASLLEIFGQHLIEFTAVCNARLK